MYLIYCCQFIVMSNSSNQPEIIPKPPVIELIPKNIPIIDYKPEIKLSRDLISVNYHIIKACNYRCVFCFAKFNQVSRNYLSLEDSKSIIQELHLFGTEKITFVGGEPTLVPHLPELVSYAKSLGLTTMIVTNGTKLSEEYLKRFNGNLDWVGLSIDSGKEDINRELGRGNGSHVSQTLKNVKLLREFGIKIKINSVINLLNWQEDMSWLIESINPFRWKVFKLLPIEGENDESKHLEISDEQYFSFIQNHRHLNPVVETNDAMTDSYVMIDPNGCFFNNSNGRLNHGPPILAVGVEKAFSLSNFQKEKFEARGGVYKW